MGLTTFTFDSPISVNTNAYQKSQRHSRTPSCSLPTPNKEKTKHAYSSIFSSIANHILQPFRHNSVSGENQIVEGSSDKQIVKEVLVPKFAKDSALFRLPKDVRTKIYEYVYGPQEIFHILLRRNHDTGHSLLRKTNKYTIGHRRCRANGHLEECVLAKCKSMFDLQNGIYLGPFDSILGLLLTAKNFYTEALPYLYAQNTFEFDHPASFLLFSSHLPQSPTHNITNLTITIPTMFYNYTSSHISCPSFAPSQWSEMWELIASSPAIEELRVVFKLPVEGWMGWSLKEVLEPLSKVEMEGSGLRKFDVEMPIGRKENWALIESVVNQKPYRLIGVGRSGERRVAVLKASGSMG